MAGIDSYRTGLRSATRGLWSGVLDAAQFRDAMQSLINRRLTQAFQEGAAECGIKPDEFTEEEQAALDQAIQEEKGHIGDLSSRIDKNSKANGGKLKPLLNRVSTLWVNRYRDLKNLGLQMTCQDKKLLWELGATEKHCRTCPRLDGKVKRGSFWLGRGIRPQDPPNSKLECKGYRCLCTLNPTDRAISKGPLPRVP